MSKIEIIGEVTTVTRKGGNKTARVVIEIPHDKAAKIPMGLVNITIQASQGDMFEEEK